MKMFFNTKSSVTGWDRVASFHYGEAQRAKLLLSRQHVLSARLQPGKDPTIIIGEIVELLDALNEVEFYVHKEFILLHFVDNLPPDYESIKNNLPCSKEPITRVVLEDALRSSDTINNRTGEREGRFRILHYSCPARRLAGELVAAEVAVEPI